MQKQSLQTTMFLCCHGNYRSMILDMPLTVTWLLRNCCDWLVAAGHTASCLFFSQHPKLCCSASLRESIPDRPSGGGASLFLPVTSLLWCHHAACSSRGGSWDCFRLHPAVRPLLYTSGSLLWRYCWSNPLTLGLAALRLLIGQWGQSRVHQWGGRKQFKPANHHVWQV